MSLSWRNQLHIELHPDRVGLVRLSRGWQPREIARKTVPCAAPGVGEAPWEAALRALQTGISDMGGGGADVTVVLSTHFVRYALIPWSDQLSNDSEEQAYVRHCFAQTYGDDAERWVLRLSPNGPGEMQVASAIDQGLLDGLEQVASANGLHLVSVQPNLMTVFNHWRRSLSGPTAWLVVAEQGRVCISLLKSGRWCSLQTMKTDEDWPDRLPQLLERALHLSGHGTERGKVFLFAPGAAEEAILPVAGWKILWLPAVAGAPAPTYAGPLLANG